METDPVAAFAHLVRRAVTAALGDDHADVDPQVRRSDRADVQADLAMRLARRARQPPRAIADAIVAALPANDLLASVEIAGPGFINATLRDGWLASAVASVAADDRLGVPVTTSPDRVVVDYSHPNVAKEMHVGHLRSTVIGDALVRVLAFRGHIYDACPVLTAGPEVRASRLVLVDTTARVLARALELLGIAVPDRM